MAAWGCSLRHRSRQAAQDAGSTTHQPSCSKHKAMNIQTFYSHFVQHINSCVATGCREHHASPQLQQVRQTQGKFAEVSSILDNLMKAACLNSKI
jgi:hypothetical protein